MVKWRMETSYEENFSDNKVSDSDFLRYFVVSLSSIFSDLIFKVQTLPILCVCKPVWPWWRVFEGKRRAGVMERKGMVGAQGIARGLTHRVQTLPSVIARPTKTAMLRRLVFIKKGVYSLQLLIRVFRKPKASLKRARSARHARKGNAQKSSTLSK